MYVCLCNGITERDVRACMREGVNCLEELACRTGVGTGCGCCREFAAELLRETHLVRAPTEIAA